jgi:hypothetical protein
VTKLAEERENNSREGMRMMGLDDSCYYKAWAAFYSAIIVLTSLEVSVILSIEVF